MSCWLATFLLVLILNLWPGLGLLNFMVLTFLKYLTEIKIIFMLCNRGGHIMFLDNSACWMCFKLLWCSTKVLPFIRLVRGITTIFLHTRVGAAASFHSTVKRLTGRWKSMWKFSQNPCHQHTITLSNQQETLVQRHHLSPSSHLQTLPDVFDTAHWSWVSAVVGHPVHCLLKGIIYSSVLMKNLKNSCTYILIM